MPKLLYFCTTFIISTLFLFLHSSSVYAQTVRITSPGPSTLKVYEKYELKFAVSTSSQYPFLQYDPAPPPGVKAGIGISVEGIFKKSGKTWVQPAFYMTETNQIGTGTKMYFTETGKKYWALRFSPAETGTYDVSVHVKDAKQDVTTSIGTFTATNPSKKGFVKVSKSDSRYFEFSNGEIFWPIGPAFVSDNDFAKYGSSGLNFERPWLGGLGAYSSNWARWKSSGARAGNEGFASPLEFNVINSYPGSDLSYVIYSPAGYRIWLGTYNDTMFGPRIMAGKKYQYKITFNAQNISGPRDRSFPHGFVIKSIVGPGVFGTADDRTEFERLLRDPDPKSATAPQIILPHNSGNKGWQTLTGTYTADAKTGRNSIYLYLDNVAFDKGAVNIDEFSMREVLPDGSLGGEIIRNPKADLHTYVEQRPAAYLDWQIGEGEKYGIYYKYVVHDKNDMIQNHLKSDGTFVGYIKGADGTNYPAGDGYYQGENTKARWLLRQWYRYIAARWGYSTAVHSWELNNEGPPVNTGPHANTAQAFAKYMHTIDAHRHLATTSFWCCFRPGFWGNSSGAFPDIDYADIHEYTANALEEKNRVVYPYDMAMWNYDTGRIAASYQVGKPIIRAETGISLSPDPLLVTNPGIWYHNLLWSQLSPYSLFDTGYWFFRHFEDKQGNKLIDQYAISKSFAAFARTLDVNKGGYKDIQSSVSNGKIRAWGQKNLSSNKAYMWIQNSDHTWKNVMDGVGSQQSANITIKLNPNTSYRLEWWNTCSGKEANGCIASMVRTETKVTSGAGDITISVQNLADDKAVKIVSSTTPLSTPIPTTHFPTSTTAPIATNVPTSSPQPTVTISPIGNGEVDGISPVNFADALYLFNNWLKTGGMTPKQGLDQYADGVVNSLDFGVVYKILPH